VRPDQLIGRHAFELTPGEAAREAITRALAGESASATVGDGEVTFDVSWQPVLDGGQLAAIAIDVDGFKTVNDSLGHAAGDDVLRELARRLSGVAEEHGAFLARQGATGSRCSSPSARGRRCARRPSGSPTRRSRSSASRSPRAGRRPAARLVRRRERRRARAPDAHRPDPGRAGNGELCLHYQPIRDLHAGHCSGVEALIRWNDPERGLGSPDEFIPAAEASGLIDDIGRWVADEVCRQWRVWAGDASAIVTAILALATALGMDAVAEGVETAEQLDFLDAMGCRRVQGYHIARPMPAAQVTEYLRLHGPAATHSQLRSAA
jgi:predicted signal transduction protein with EAL and GGDEF domain